MAQPREEAEGHNSNLEQSRESDNNITDLDLVAHPRRLLKVITTFLPPHAAVQTLMKWWMVGSCSPCLRKHFTAQEMLSYLLEDGRAFFHHPRCPRQQSLKCHERGGGGRKAGTQDPHFPKCILPPGTPHKHFVWCVFKPDLTLHLMSLQFLINSLFHCILFC